MLWLSTGSTKFHHPDDLGFSTKSQNAFPATSDRTFKPRLSLATEFGCFIWIIRIRLFTGLCKYLRFSFIFCYFSRQGFFEGGAYWSRSLFCSKVLARSSHLIVLPGKFSGSFENLWFYTFQCGFFELVLLPLASPFWQNDNQKHFFDDISLPADFTIKIVM